MSRRSPRTNVNWRPKKEDHRSSSSSSSSTLESNQMSNIEKRLQFLNQNVSQRMTRPRAWINCLSNSFDLITLFLSINFWLLHFNQLKKIIKHSLKHTTCLNCVYFEQFERKILTSTPKMDTIWNQILFFKKWEHIIKVRSKWNFNIHERFSVRVHF